MFTTDAEFDGLSSALYRNEIGIAFITKDIIKNITSIICTHMVNFCKNIFWTHPIYQMVLPVNTVKFFEIIPDSFIVHLTEHPN